MSTKVGMNLFEKYTVQKREHDTACFELSEKIKEQKLLADGHRSQRRTWEEAQCRESIAALNLEIARYESEWRAVEDKFVTFDRTATDPIMEDLRAQVTFYDQEIFRLFGLLLDAVKARCETNRQHIENEKLIVRFQTKGHPGQGYVAAKDTLAHGFELKSQDPKARITDAMTELCTQYSKLIGNLDVKPEFSAFIRRIR